MPSYTELIAYVFDPMSNLAGPFTEFTQFMDFIHMRKAYANIPLTIVRPLLHFLMGFGFIGCNLLLTNLGFDSKQALEPSFKDYSYLWKVFWMDLTCLQIRFKYYVAWQF